MPGASELLEAIDSCPNGTAGWRQFEDVCIDALTFLFVPPLEEPRIQARSYSGIDRRDAIFPNRNTDQSIWGQLREELRARLILFEFKNYDASELGADEIDQVRIYLSRPMGKLAILISSKEPHSHARLRCNQVYTQDGKVILLMSREHLKEMIYVKERGDDPGSIVMEQLESFYIQYE